ncbi:MAG TPA: hypothetical protein VEB21_14385 [Terriglobales bacterium]|nr:hypothetical protein [Terriglobales bacterium]
MATRRSVAFANVVFVVALIAAGCGGDGNNGGGDVRAANPEEDVISTYAHQLLDEGRQAFRHDTFGDEDRDLIEYLKSL